MLSFVVDVVKRINVGPDGTHIGVVTFGNDAELIFDLNEFNKTTDYEMRICNKIESIPRPSSGERTFINRGLRLANRRVLRETFGMRPEVKSVCTFCNILCLSVCLCVCQSVSLSLSPPPPNPPISLSPLVALFFSLHMLFTYFFQTLLLITDGRQTQISNRNEPTPVQVSTATKNRGIEISAIGIGAADVLGLLDYASKPDNVLFVQDFSILHEMVSDTRVLLLGPSKLV